MRRFLRHPPHGVRCCLPRPLLVRVSYVVFSNVIFSVVIPFDVIPVTLVVPGIPDIPVVLFRSVLTTATGVLV